MVAKFDIQFLVTILGLWGVLYIISNVRLSKRGKPGGRSVATSSKKVKEVVCTVPDKPNNAKDEGSCKDKTELSPGESCGWTGETGYNCSDVQCSDDSVVTNSTCSQVCDASNLLTNAKSVGDCTSGMLPDSTCQQEPNTTNIECTASSCSTTGVFTAGECTCKTGWAGESCEGVLLKVDGKNTNVSNITGGTENQKYFELAHPEAVYYPELCPTKSDPDGCVSGTDNTIFEVEHYKLDNGEYVLQDYSSATNPWTQIKMFTGNAPSFRIHPKSSADHSAGKVWSDGDMIKIGAGSI